MGLVTVAVLNAVVTGLEVEDEVMEVLAVVIEVAAVLLAVDLVALLFFASFLHSCL